MKSTIGELEAIRLRLREAERSDEKPLSVRVSEFRTAVSEGVSGIVSSVKELASQDKAQVSAISYSYNSCI